MNIELPKTKNRSARQALLEVRYCPLKIRSPQRLKNQAYFDIYAVHAVEINVPEDCEPVEWMLLTTEDVTTEVEAQTILRWYTYRWRIEEYHKILALRMQSGKLSSWRRQYGSFTRVFNQYCR